MINEQEINSMLKQDANTRLDYTIKRIADFENVWVIEEDDKYTTLGDDSGNRIFPLWPFKEFAELFCVGEYSNCTVSSIPLNDFLELEIPNFQRAGLKLSVFPLNTGRGSVIEIDLFLNLLNEEIDKY